MLRLHKLTEKDCVELEELSQGAIEFEYAEGIRKVSIKMAGLPPLSFSTDFSSLNAYKQDVNVVYMVEWSRVVDGKPLQLQETFPDEESRTLFIGEQLGDLDEDQALLSEVKFYS